MSDSKNIADIQNQFSEQQKKITDLKELLLKSEVAHNQSTSSAQEKVKSIAQRLSSLKSKVRSRPNLATQSDLPHSSASSSSSSQQQLSAIGNVSEQPCTSTQAQQKDINLSPTDSETKIPESTAATTAVTAITSSSGKIQLLRQQVEENKARLAQRASSKQHLENLVSQLREKFDTTQQWIEDTNELGKSMNDLSVLASTPNVSTRYRSATDLSGQPFSLEKERIKFLDNRCRLLEKQLEKERQANLNRSDASAIETTASSARIKELETSLSESKLNLEKQINIIQELNEQMVEKDALLQKLEEEKQLMKNLSDGDENDESTKESLRAELAEKTKRITNLEEDNKMLETVRNDLASRNTVLEEKLQQFEITLTASTNGIERLSAELLQAQFKFAALELVLQAQQNAANAAAAAGEGDGDGDGDDDGESDADIKAEMAKEIQELQDSLQALKDTNQSLQDSLTNQQKLEVSDFSIADKIAELEAIIATQREEIKQRNETLIRNEEEIMEKTIELNVLNANFKALQDKVQANSKPKTLFPAIESDDANSAELRHEIQQLKQKLDEANKVTIKLKLKCKQSEKQIEKLNKTSDLHGEFTKLTQLNTELQQKITELEDEKGQWQLQEVSSDTSTVNNAENLQQIATLKAELEIALDKLKQQDHEETIRVKTEMSAIQLEEQLDEQKQQIDLLQKQLTAKNDELTQIEEKLKEIETQKLETDKKLEHYINENIELVDKVEKLSKSSSSAESIEIVERLTQQERAEIDEFHKRLESSEPLQSPPSQVSELTQTEIGSELSETLVKLNEESSELMNKIELFTTERREVLEKMEHLTSENQDLLEKIEQLTKQKETLEKDARIADVEKAKLEQCLQEVIKEKELLAVQAAESGIEKSNLSQELNTMQKSSEVVAALDGPDTTTLFDKCEKSLTKLNAELEQYCKANDKNAIFNASKKLAKEAKNAYTQLSELLQKVKEASTAVETVTVVETVVAVTASNGKALAEYEQLTKQNRELKTLVDNLKRQLDEMQESAQHSITTNDDNIDLAYTKEDYDQHLKEFEFVQQECETLQETIVSLGQQLEATKADNEEKTNQITKMNDELNELRQLSENFDRQINEKELVSQRQIEELTRLHKELELKCTTYEGEMEILQTLVTEQKQQLIDSYSENEHEINLKLIDLQERNEQIASLQNEIRELKTPSTNVDEENPDNLQIECEKLQATLKVNKTLVNEQINELANKQETIDVLNEQIIGLYKSLEDIDEDLCKKNDEIVSLKQKLDQNKNDIELLRKDNDEQKSVVDKLLIELHTHREKSQDLQRLEAKIRLLENTKQELENRNKEQMEKMKKYAANLKKRTLQCQTLETQCQTLENQVCDLHDKCTSTTTVTLETRVAELEAKLTLNEHEHRHLLDALRHKTTESLERMEKYKKLEERLALVLVGLQNTFEMYSHLTDEEAMKQLIDKDEVIEALEHAIEQVNTCLTAQQTELVEAQTQLAVTNEELQIQQQVLLLVKDEVSQHTDRVIELQNDLKTKTLKFEKSKAVIKERNAQIQRLQGQLKELQDQLSAEPEEVPTAATVTAEEYDILKNKYEALNEQYTNEKATFEETIQRLETLHHSIEAKLQQDMAYIETIEAENGKFKEKICKLEECVASFEERRTSMERRANLLSDELQSRANQYERSEDELIYRLNMLSEHDEIIGQRLITSQEEKEEVQERFEDMQRQYNELKKKYTKMETDMQAQQETLQQTQEADVEALQKKITTLEAEMTRQRNVHDAKLAAKVTELDEIECELNDQLERLHAEKRTISEDLQRSVDECNEGKDEIMRLRESLNNTEQSKQELEREVTWLRLQSESIEQDQIESQEMRMQSIQDKTEIENLRHQIEVLADNHEMDMQALRDQLIENETMRLQLGQNQTDDQVFIEAENKRLAELLAEKQICIENYQRQIMQLQVIAANMSQQQQAAQAAAAAAQAQSESPYVITFSTDQPHSRRPWPSDEEENHMSDNQAQFLPSPPPSSATIFFDSNDPMVPSAFDELVQLHNNEVGTSSSSTTVSTPQHSAAHGIRQQNAATIEDLQRNVSDLEKHAHDLENKLTAQNLRACELSTSLREAEANLAQAEIRERDFDRQFQRALSRVEQLELEHVVHLQTQSDMRKKIEELKRQLEVREQQLEDAFIEPVATYEQNTQQDRRNLTERILANIESQIASDEDLQQPSLGMFFGRLTPSEANRQCASDEPVQETLIVPKTAYTCQPPEDANAANSLNAGLAASLGTEWDDDVWGSNEAVAEAAHRQTTATPTKSSLVSREQQLEIQLQDANEHIQQLQKELFDGEKQKRELQIKSAKMMKKLKENKIKLDELQATTSANVFRKSTSTESNAMFADLDAAIQDELKSQIARLEEKLNEHSKMIENNGLEKEKLLKRIDVLTAGNERMAEMKERQDIELLMYQTRIREMQEKLNKLDEWTETNETAQNDNATKSINEPAIAEEPTTNTTQKFLEEKLIQLSADVKDLTVEKEELQAILDDERSQLVRFEETVHNLQQKLNDSADANAELQKRMEALQQLYNETQEQAQNANQKELELNVKLAEKSQENEKAQKENVQLKEKLQTLEENVNILKNQINELEMEKSSRKRNDDDELTKQQIENQQLNNDKAKLENKIELLNGELKKVQEELLKAEEKSLLVTEKQPNDREIENLISVVPRHDDLNAKLQEKESEIEHLKQRIEDLMRDDQTEKLVLEILTKNQEIHLLKMDVKHLEDDKQELIEQALAHEKQNSTNDADEKNVLKETIQKLELELKQLKSEKQQMEEELEVLNNHVLSTLESEEKIKQTVLELDTKNIEIKELRRSLDSLKASTENQQSIATSSTQPPPVDYIALNAQWESIIEDKCGEIATMWRQHMERREKEFKDIESRLRAEIEDLKVVAAAKTTIEQKEQQLQQNNPIIHSGENTAGTSTTASESVSRTTSSATSNEGTPSHDSANAVAEIAEKSKIHENNSELSTIERMQAALESQEIEIVTLKEQLAIRSAEYARLAAQYDPYKLHTTTSHSGVSTSAFNANQDNNAFVPKSKLDLALYVLHQRDMRCEEMTLELVNLLEERDTLQLKLSNTLRLVESIKAQANYIESASNEPNAIPNESPNKSQVAGATADDSNNELNQKLSQLQTVDHSKDKVIKEQREQRIRQMESIHQDVARIPSAAVSELVGSDISNTSQSPSSVLLNWLWGNKPTSADYSTNANQ